MVGGLPSYLVVRGAARDVKLRRLTPAEKLAFFCGILSIARGSDPPGCLLVGPVEATAEDIAHEADVPKKDAERALVKLEHVGILVRDQGVLRVHRWADHQPEATRRRPSDAPAARAERKRRSRTENAELDVPPTSTRQRDMKRREEFVSELAAEMFPDDEARRMLVVHALKRGARTKKAVRDWITAYETTGRDVVLEVVS